MKEDCVDLWTVDCDARCITTNGTVKANGRGVMGRGCAKEAKERFFALELRLGQHLRQMGNCVGVLLVDASLGPLVVFPVKHAWHERADLDLIVASAHELVALTNVQGWKDVVLPRPGCGNGHRSWEREVRPLLQPILDDRFLVVTL